MPNNFEMDTGTAPVHACCLSHDTTFTSFTGSHFGWVCLYVLSPNGHNDETNDGVVPKEDIACVLVLISTNRHHLGLGTGQITRPGPPELPQVFTEFIYLLNYVLIGILRMVSHTESINQLKDLTFAKVTCQTMIKMTQEICEE